MTESLYIFSDKGYSVRKTSQEGRMLFKNIVAQKLEISSRSHRNCFRENTGNTDKHERAKFEVYNWLRRNGLEVITEAEFRDKSGKADILILDFNVVVEILYSEKVVEAKKKNYPVKEIVLIDAKKDLSKQIQENLEWRV